MLSENNEYECLKKKMKIIFLDDIIFYFKNKNINFGIIRFISY